MAYADGNLFGAPITIPAAQVPANQTNFAVLLSSANMPAALLSFLAASGGGSLRAYLDVGQSVRYALEYVNATQVWVCAPSLSSATDTTIWLFWGGALSQPARDAAYGSEAVWPDPWRMVQHMEADPSGAAPQGVDSTQYNNDATSAGAMTSADYVDGKIGKCWDFDGSNDAGVVPFSASLNDYTDKITVMAWTDPGGTTARIVASRWNGTENNWVLSSNGSTLSATVNRTVGGAASATRTLVGSPMHHAAFSYNGSNIVAYSNSTPGAVVAASGVMDTGASAVNIGSFVAPSGTNFSGRIDEVRIYHGAMTANDILAHYRAQSSPATFAVFGTIVQAPSGGAITTLWSYYGG